MQNAITWFDIPSTDFERAVTFYSTILDAPVRVQEFNGQTMGFFPMEGKEGVGGALMPPMENFKPSAQGTHVFFPVKDIDKAASKVEQAGGKIAVPKYMLPDVGWIVMILDTEGNSVGLHSPK